MNRFKRFTTFATLLLTLAMAAAASATPWKFAVTCDSRSSYYNDNPLPGPDGVVPSSALTSQYYDAATGISPFFKNVASALSKETGIDFVLFPGDIARGKKLAPNGKGPTDDQFKAAIVEWNKQLKPVTDAGIPVYTIRGNHDAYGPNSASPAATLTSAKTTWLDNIVNPAGSTQDPSQPGLTFSFTHKGSLFVGLDEYPNGTSSPTGYDSAFLKGELAKQAQHKFVFAHQPVWNYKSDELGPADLADNLNKGGVDLYFSGHVHSYQRIGKSGYNFQEMIIGTGGAPQDNPTLVSGIAPYTPDPAMKVLSYAGGVGANVRFGYAIITVNDDGSISTEMKFLSDPYSANPSVYSFDQANIPAKPLKFGVNGDTQWTPGNDPAGTNPNHVPKSIINQVNQQFINQGVKFVIQPGDLTENGADADIAVHASAVQALYDYGIGFFPMRGNHETYTSGNSYGIPAVQSNFPQTQCSGAHVFGASNCTSPNLGGVNADDLKGMSYSFDYDNLGSKARFVIIDEWVTPNKLVSAAGYTYGWSIAEQQPWIDTSLDKTTRGADHAFVFAHQNLIGENHQDTLFQGYANANLAMQNDFFASLQNNNVKYYISGHDHVHQRSLIASPDGNSTVQELIAASNSSKFYTPKVITDPNWFGQKSRETSVSQELYTVGYYIYTVDGPRVTVDFYSDNHGNWLSDANYPFGTADVTNYPLGYTPTFTFVKKETWGYSTNGQEFTVQQGKSYVTEAVNTKTKNTGAVQDVIAAGNGYHGTSAQILDGANGSSKKDYTNRQLTRVVNTGWAPKGNDTVSDVFSLWGMTDLGAGSSDTFALSLSYDPASVSAAQIPNGIRLSTRNANGTWVNAVDVNSGGTSTFVNRAWQLGDTLGTYGIDTAAKTVWAVVNHASDFAVTPVTQAVTVTTVPASRIITVDGATYNSPYTFTWNVGSSHTIAVSSPQSAITGTRYVFGAWSDGGAQSRSITVPATATTYTANFTTQYQLTTAVAPAGTGTASPISGTWYPAGTIVPVKAFANAGYSFLNWTGLVANSSSVATTVTMSGPQSITANLAASPLLSAAISGKSGLGNARIWTIKVSNNGLSTAVGAQITGLTLTKTDGTATPACAPTVVTPFPVALSSIDIIAGGSATGDVTIDFSTCAPAARFTATIAYSSNGGAVTGSKSYGNQFR